MVDDDYRDLKAEICLVNARITRLNERLQVVEGKAGCEGGFCQAVEDDFEPGNIIYYKEDRATPLEIYTVTRDKNGIRSFVVGGEEKRDWYEYLVKEGD